MNSSSFIRCSSGELRCYDAFNSPYCLRIEMFQCGLDCPCPPLKAESDIAGLGILVAFFVSAFLTWISTCAYLMLREKKERRVNIIDHNWTKHICNRVRKRTKHADVLAECFFRLTLSLSDQQLVTGIAITVAGLRMLARGSISVYHFSIITDLAFFSSLAHLLSLLALWSVFSSDRKRLTRSGKRRRFPLTFTTKWRLFCIFVFFVLVLVCTWMKGYRDWNEMYDCPVHCVPRGVKELGGQPLAWAIATTYFLVTGYSQYVMQFGESIIGHDKSIRRRARVASTGSDKHIKEVLTSSPIALKVCHGLRKAALMGRFWAFSEATELLVMLGWFIANCYWTFEDKLLGHDLLSKQEWTKENELGFGQIVPLVLLMLPMMTFLEAYHDNMEWMETEGQDIELDVTTENWTATSVVI